MYPPINLKSFEVFFKFEIGELLKLGKHFHMCQNKNIAQGFVCIFVYIYLAKDIQGLKHVI